MNREELIDQILDARTIQEINAATRAVSKYQRQQPELDIGVAMACEQLAMMRGAIEMTKGEQ